MESVCAGIRHTLNDPEKSQAIREAHQNVLKEKLQEMEKWAESHV